MSYIPVDAKWYVAELVSETKVEDDQRNVVHRDFVLVEASSPEEAYEKSLQLGRENNATFENPEGKVVRITFRGIAELGVIGAELKHGTEILFNEQIGVPENRIQQLIVPKERLGFFVLSSRAQARIMPREKFWKKLTQFSKIKSRRSARPTRSDWTTIYLYDGPNTIEELEANGNEVARYSQDAGIDLPLAQMLAGTTSFYQQDVLGSVTSLSSTTDTLANTYTFDAFGNLVASTGSPGNPFPVHRARLRS